MQSACCSRFGSCLKATFWQILARCQDSHPTFCVDWISSLPRICLMSAYLTPRFTVGSARGSVEVNPFTVYMTSVPKTCNEWTLLCHGVPPNPSVHYLIGGFYPPERIYKSHLRWHENIQCEICKVVKTWSHQPAQLSVFSLHLEFWGICPISTTCDSAHPCLQQGRCMHHPPPADHRMMSIISGYASNATPQ